ncbi:unnamed protein product [Rotaria sp. Silwood2]|nr:unnamed protein product [Rotaria sp. Silwood2]CAF4340274.1 unnamed protein product [Rotaria sp. Silwood2]
MNLTDHTLLVPMFIEVGYAAATVKWLDGSSFENLTGNLNTTILGIIYNLSRHSKGSKALRKEQAFEILMKRKSFIMSQEKSIHVFGSLLIALAKNDEEQKANRDLFLQTSEKLFQDINMIHKKNGDLRHGGYHLSELLYLLHGAFSNTAIVRNILGDEFDVKRESILFFGDLFLTVYGPLFDHEADHPEKLVGISLLKILLCISNYPEYLNVLKSHLPLCVLIESLAKKPKQDVAKRTWFNIQLLSNLNSSPNESKIDKDPMICISYNWADKEICKSFVKNLRNFTSVTIWVDYENVDETDAIWDFIAPAIDSATIIVVLASSAYDDSRTNRQELIYAMSRARLHNKGLRFIVVDIEVNFKFNREWMRNLLEDKERISYKDKTEEMAKEVAIRVLLSKNNSLITCTSGTTTQSRVCTIM